MRNSIWSSEVNLILSLMFVGSFALGAGLILWHAFFGVNPVADLLVSQVM